MSGSCAVLTLELARISPFLGWLPARELVADVWSTFRCLGFMLNHSWAYLGTSTAKFEQLLLLWADLGCVLDSMLGYPASKFDNVANSEAKATPPKLKDIIKIY